MLGILRCKVLVSTDNTLGLIFSSQKIIKKQKPLRMVPQNYSATNKKEGITKGKSAHTADHPANRTLGVEDSRVS